MSGIGAVRLATIASAIAEQGSNIENVNSREKDGMTTTLDFLVNVTDENISPSSCDGYARSLR